MDFQPTDKMRRTNTEKISSPMGTAQNNGAAIGSNTPQQLRARENSRDAATSNPAMSNAMKSASVMLRAKATEDQAAITAGLTADDAVNKEFVDGMQAIATQVIALREKLVRSLTDYQKGTVVRRVLQRRAGRVKILNEITRDIDAAVKRNMRDISA